MNRFVIGLASVLHLVPHPFGVSPVGAMALYAGAHGDKRFSWATPLLPLTVAAALFGFYELLVMVFVFAGFALATLAGRWLQRGKRSYARYGSAIALGAAIFFVVSNFGNWLAFQEFYTPGIAGLVQCYVNGLPFFGQAIVADAAYCFVLFGLHKLLERQQAEAAHA